MDLVVYLLFNVGYMHSFITIYSVSNIVIPRKRGGGAIKDPKLFILQAARVGSHIHTTSSMQQL